MVCLHPGEVLGLQQTGSLVRGEKMRYVLKLGNGSGWSFIATPGTRAWVEKFATIMGLRAEEQNLSHKWPRIFFVRKDAGKDGDRPLINSVVSKIAPDLPGRGWRAQNLQTLRLWSHQSCPDVIYEMGNEGNRQLDIIRMWTSLYIIYLQVEDSGGLPLHAALIERDGMGVLLAGTGGSGKSTLCRRLPRSWSALNDDQSLLVPDGDKSYRAHPFPTWTDYLLRREEPRWKVEHYVRPAAIFFVEQATSDEVVSIGQGHTAAFINYSSIEAHRATCWKMGNEEMGKLRKKIFDNSCQVARAIPGYILRTSLDGRCWEEMERVI